MKRETVQQGGRGNNNVMIGTADAGAHVTVVQQQSGGGKQSVQPVEYDKTLRVEVFTSRQVIGRAVTAASAFVVAGIAIFSDLLQAAAAFGLTKLQIAVPIVLACLLTIAVTLRHARMLLLPADDKQDHYLLRRWVHKGSDGVYQLFDKEGRCTHPHCNGVIRIDPAPARERGNHLLAGVCSLGGRLHTYTVEHNGIGWPHEFDWREPDPKR
jgi:hypothetical protein